jgi:hypothetical protein
MSCWTRQPDSLKKNDYADVLTYFSMASHTQVRFLVKPKVLLMVVFLEHPIEAMSRV